MGEKPEAKRERGAFSGREIFYFFFALLVFACLAYVFSIEWSDHRDEAKQKRETKLAKAREVARIIGGTGGFVISDAQVLYHGVYHHATNPWLIYDLGKDEISDGRYLTRALEKPGPYHDALTNGGLLSGWKGNLVLTTTERKGYWSPIFQWRTNSDELQVSESVESNGNIKFGLVTPVIAVDGGWNSFAFFQGSTSRRAMLVANRNDRTTTSLLPTNLTISWYSGFQDGVYSVSGNSNGITADVEIFSLTNQSIIFSNAAVRMPRKYDELATRPDPAGRRVLWMFGVEPKLNAKLRSILPAAIVPAQAETKWYLYSSDLHATKFTFICVAKAEYYSDQPPEFLWGINGDSIWLLDDDEGIKRVELK